MKILFIPKLLIGLVFYSILLMILLPIKKAMDEMRYIDSKDKS